MSGHLDGNLTALSRLNNSLFGIGWNFPVVIIHTLLSQQVQEDRSFHIVVVDSVEALGFCCFFLPPTIMELFFFLLVPLTRFLRWGMSSYNSSSSSCSNSSFSNSSLSSANSSSSSSHSCSSSSMSESSNWMHRFRTGFLVAIASFWEPHCDLGAVSTTSPSSSSLPPLSVHWILFWMHFHEFMQPREEEEEGTGAWITQQLGQTRPMLPNKIERRWQSRWCRCNGMRHNHISPTRWSTELICSIDLGP